MLLSLFMALENFWQRQDKISNLLFFSLQSPHHQRLHSLPSECLRTPKNSNSDFRYTHARHPQCSLLCIYTIYFWKIDFREGMRQMANERRKKMLGIKRKIRYQQTKQQTHRDNGKGRKILCAFLCSPSSTTHKFRAT